VADHDRPLGVHPLDAVTDAAEITRRAKSNLAFALSVLPEERRADAVIYYAFCRTLDDLADEPGMAVEERERALVAWRDGLLNGFTAPDALQSEVVAMRDKHGIPNEWLAALADGCIEDLHPKRYRTWEELDGYIWKVAGSVGVVSARLFGCVDPAVGLYAETLGRALQMTNIIRDVAEDWGNGKRIYLPMEELERSGIAEADFDKQPDGGKFSDLMGQVTERAEGCFREAGRLMPERDRKALLPARIMAEIYQELLEKMRADGFHVFQKRYRVPLWHKLWILTKNRISG
jgi:15-cis-phytoene synthase